MAVPDPGRVRAAVLRHTGHGPAHLDIVLAGGLGGCPTIRLAGRRWSWQAPHRRRYLTYAGPVSGGRGSVTRLWWGLVRLIRCNNGWQLSLDDFSIHLRRDGVVLLAGASHSRAWDSMIRA